VLQYFRKCSCGSNGRFTSFFGHTALQRLASSLAEDRATGRHSLISLRVPNKNLMNIQFTQTGDPWHDWGLCELYELLQRFCEWPDGSNIVVSQPGESGFTISGNVTPEQFGQTLHASLSAPERWNDLYPRFEEGRKISRCQPRTEKGRRIPDEKYEPKVSKAEWEAAGCKGKLPDAPRNCCQRIASVPMQPSKLAKVLRLEGGPESVECVAVDAAAFKEGVVTQNVNPLAGKYQGNQKVRGVGGDGYSRTSASFILVCLCASLSAWKPFVKDGDCIVYLPDDLPFSRALRLWKQLTTTGVLIHPDQPDKGNMYRNLPSQGDGEEAQLLMLLDALQSSLGLRTEGEGLFESDMLTLNNWLAIHFSSGTTVSVGAVHRIEIPGTVFPLLSSIPCPNYWKSETDVSFVRDCLIGLRMKISPIQNRIAHALFQTNRDNSWQSLATTAFFLYKNANQAGISSPSARHLLPHFHFHFAKELLTMTDEQLTSCRKIGELIGSAFSTDVTLISRLYNTARPDDLLSNLNLIGFRLFKASNGDADDRRGLWHVSPQEFRAVLDLAATSDWQAAAQTISIFASLTAFNKNLDKGKEGN